MDRKYGCAFLAGGAGSRMGHVNKAELEYRGQTFAESIMAEMEEAGMPCYLSVANYEQAVPAGWKAVRDIVTGQDGGYIGPMGGVYSCLVIAQSDGLDGLFFAPCDAPLYSREVAFALKEYIDRDSDSVLWRTSDGRLQTTFGWYSVRCIPAMKQVAESSEYRLRTMLDRVNSKIVDIVETGIDDRIFRNINLTEDYLRLSRDAGRRHMLICGGRQTGKTTLIEKVTSDLDVPVYGYRTRIFREDADGISRVYMYSAAGGDPHRGPDNYIGSTKGRVLDINTDAFDLLGTELIHSASADGILVMDEIGFMERDAAEFRRAVREAFDGDIHILAAIKDTDKFSEHIEDIRNHPGAELVMLTEDNRDRISEDVKAIVKGWEKEITGRREKDHDQ